MLCAGLTAKIEATVPAVAVIECTKNGPPKEAVCIGAQKGLLPIVPTIGTLDTIRILLIF